MNNSKIEELEKEVAELRSDISSLRGIVNSLLESRNSDLQMQLLRFRQNEMLTEFAEMFKPKSNYMIQDSKDF